jgi:hypothetical protein
MTITGTCLHPISHLRVMHNLPHTTGCSCLCSSPPLPLSISLLPIQYTCYYLYWRKHNTLFHSSLPAPAGLPAVPL